MTAIIILSLLGLLNTSYLISCKVQKKDVKCLVFPKEWCKKVQYSKYAKTLGIPNAYAGFGMYAALLISAILYNKGIVSLLPVQIIISIGFVFSLYFTAIQAFVLKAFCTWCVLSSIEFVILFCLMLSL